MPKRKGRPKRGKLAGSVILLIRATESMIAVGIVTGVNVIQLFLQNPFEFHRKLWDEIYKAGNLLWLLILILILYLTNLDAPLLRRLGLWLEEEDVE